MRYQMGMTQHDGEIINADDEQQGESIYALQQILIN